MPEFIPLREWGRREMFEGAAPAIEQRYHALVQGLRTPHRCLWCGQDATHPRSMRFYSLNGRTGWSCTGQPPREDT